MPASRKISGHELGVGDADAEAQRAHPAEAEHLVLQLLQDDGRASSVAGVEAGELGVVIATAGPPDRAAGRCRRRRRSSGTGRAGQRRARPRDGARRRSGPRRRSRTSSPSDRSGVAVRPSSSRGCEVVEQPPVGRGLGVVELVDDDDLESVGGEVARRRRRSATARSRRRAAIVRGARRRRRARRSSPSFSTSR